MVLEPRAFSIVGESYGDRQRIIQAYVKYGQPIKLRREPQNEHDPNAVAVDIETPEGIQSIGYLSRADAAEIAPMIDQGIAIPARVEGKYGGTAAHPFYGVRIELDLEDGSVYYDEEEEAEESPHPAKPPKSFLQVLMNAINFKNKG